MTAPEPRPIPLFELDEVGRVRTSRRVPRPKPAPAPPHATVHQLPLLLTMEEAASLLRIGRTTIYKLAELHRSTLGASGIPTVRVGNKLLVRRADLERIVGPDDAA